MVVVVVVVYRLRKATKGAIRLETTRIRRDNVDVARKGRSSIDRSASRVYAPCERMQATVTASKKASKSNKNEWIVWMDGNQLLIGNGIVQNSELRSRPLLDFGFCR